MTDPAEIESIARQTVDCAFALHRDLGPGLLESVYEVLLFEGLRARGLSPVRQVPIRIAYHGVVIENAFRADMVVNGQVLVELKSTEKHAAVHAKQVLTYLKLASLPLGLLINFGMPTFKEGVRRFGNDYFAPPA